VIAVLEALPYVPARDQWARRISGPHIWIVLHTIEIGESPSAAESCANYFRNPGSRVASTQFVCDNNSTIRCMDWNTRGASAVGANDEGWHIEQAGFAGQSAGEWNDRYSLDMVRGQVAPLVAALCRRDRIPVRFVPADGLRRREPGITTHAECYRAFGGDVRSDPGANYPMLLLLDEVRQALNPTPLNEEEDADMVFVKFPDKPAIYSLQTDRSGRFWSFEPDGRDQLVIGAKVRLLAAGDDALDLLWERYPKVGGPLAAA